MPGPAQRRARTGLAGVMRDQLVRPSAPALRNRPAHPRRCHYGRAHAIREARGRVLDAAYLGHPERFVRKTPEPPKLPGVVWINKPENKEDPAQ